MKQNSTTCGGSGVVVVVRERDGREKSRTGARSLDPEVIRTGLSSENGPKPLDFEEKVDVTSV